MAEHRGPVSALALLGLFGCNAAAPSMGPPPSPAREVIQAPVAAIENPEEAAAGEPAQPQTYRVQDSFVKHFSEGHDERWYKADFAYLGNVQRAGWEDRHIIFKDDGIELMITREPKEMLPFTGAEYQRRGRYHFGRYEVVMRAAPGSGIVSSMFTHTGPSQNGDPHDEVDIEFLGHRTRELHINYFTSGRPAGSVYIPLPYDAAETFQLYAFEWEADQIRWYVGDQLVYTGYARDHPVPQTPSRLMINIWTGSERQYAWHGRPTFESGATAGYQCISYRQSGDTGSEQCSDSYRFDLPPVEIKGR